MAVVTLLFGVKCQIGHCDPTNSSEDEINIGVIQSLTGVGQTDGQMIVNSLQLAADQINAESPTKIKLFIEDDATQPRNTAAAYTKLRQEGIDLFIAGTWSFLVRSILPMAQRDHVVVMNSSNFSESFDPGEGGGYFFSNALPAAEHVVVLKKYISKNDIKSASLVVVNTPWGLAQAKLYRQALEQLGVKIVLDEHLDKVETNDWLDIMPRIQRANADLIVLATGNNDMNTFLKRVHEVKLPGKIFGATHTYKAFDNSSTRENFEGVCFPYPLEQFQKIDSFVKEYEKRYHTKPYLYAESSYDLLRILHQAVQISRSSSRPLNEVLQTESFNGIIGGYKYTPDRSLGAGAASLVCVKGGEMETMK